MGLEKVVVMWIGRSVDLVERQAGRDIFEQVKEFVILGVHVEVRQRIEI